MSLLWATQTITWRTTDCNSTVTNAMNFFCLSYLFCVCRPQEGNTRGSLIAARRLWRSTASGDCTKVFQRRCFEIRRASGLTSLVSRFGLLKYRAISLLVYTVMRWWYSLCIFTTGSPMDMILREPRRRSLARESDEPPLRRSASLSGRWKQRPHK